jgi:hypothetical protein
VYTISVINTHLTSADLMETWLSFGIPSPCFRVCFCAGACVCVDHSKPRRLVNGSNGLPAHAACSWHSSRPGQTIGALTNRLVGWAWRAASGDFPTRVVTLRRYLSPPYRFVGIEHMACGSWMCSFLPMMRSGSPRRKETRKHGMRDSPGWGMDDLCLG